MTDRDDHRAECIKAMKQAIWFTAHGYDGAQAQAVAALDSLPSAGALVVSPEPTKEMLEAGQRFLPIEGISNGYLRNIFAAMASIGNLTNPPEEKL